MDAVLTPEKLQGTIVKCREGAGYVITDLKNVSAKTARCVILVSNDELEPAEADKEVLRCVLCLRAVLSASHMIEETENNSDGTDLLSYTKRDTHVQVRGLRWDQTLVHRPKMMNR